MTPQRIQLRRTKGWRKPEGAIVVARPTKWGNPYKVTENTEGAEMAVQMFENELRDALEHPWDHTHSIRFWIIAASIDELRYQDLACWCPLDQPCHADVLLDIANSDREDTQ